MNNNFVLFLNMNFISFKNFNTKKFGKHNVSYISKAVCIFVVCVGQFVLHGIGMKTTL